MKGWSLLLLALLLRQPTPWKLDDQFGRPHTSSELAGKPVLLIAGGAPAAKTFDKWIDAILEAYGGSPDALPFTIIGMADVGNAPRILYPLIRRRLPRNRRRPVLVDPNGTVSRQLGIDRATSNQMVLAHDGTVLIHLRGIPVDTAGAQKIADQLRAAASRNPSARLH